MERTNKNKQTNFITKIFFLLQNKKFSKKLIIPKVAFFIYQASCVCSYADNFICKLQSQT